MQFVKELTPSKYVAAEGWYVREHGAAAEQETIVSNKESVASSEEIGQHISTQLKDRVLSSIVDEKIITITPKQRVVPQEARKIEELAIIEPVKEQIAPAVARSVLVHGVWFTANLAVENGLYYPQLIVEINNSGKGDVHALHIDLLESGLNQIVQAGFYGDGWKLFKSNGCAKLRTTRGTDSVRQGFIALHEIVNAAIARSGLPFGRTIEIF